MAPNLLITSDLHLGDPRYVERAEEFARWLARFSSRRLDGRPWRLVLAGDIFDFLLAVQPGRGRQLARVAPTRRSALNKARYVFELARPALAAMARFVLAGHEISLVPGNHDRELVLPEVAGLLRARIVEAGGGGEELRSRVFEAVRVHPWFYHERGVVHVEHGHQFDEYSSYEDPIFSLCECYGDALEEPVSHRAARLFFYRTHDVFDPDHVDVWGLWDYIRMGLRAGPRRMLGLGWYYAATVVGLVRQAWARAGSRCRTCSGRVMAHLRAQLASVGLDDAAAERVRRMWRRPANAWAILRTFFVDRLALIVALVVGTVATVWLGGLGPVTLSAVGGGAVAAGVTWWIFSHFRDVAITERVDSAAERLAEVFRVPIVVLGHSHVHVRRTLSRLGATYLNPGGWMDDGLGYFVLQRTADGRLVVRCDDTQTAGAR